MDTNRALRGLTSRGQEMLAFLKRQDAGEDIASLAREAGVQPSTLTWWRTQLRRQLAQSRETFVEVKLTEPFTSRSLTLRHGAFEIDLPSDFDEGQLARVLEVLRAC